VGQEEGGWEWVADNGSRPHDNQCSVPSITRQNRNEREAEETSPTHTLFFSSFFFSTSSFFLAFSTFSFNLGSEGLIIRFTAANLRVVLALPCYVGDGDEFAVS
jgi:hypothetical protein